MYEPWRHVKSPPAVTLSWYFSDAQAACPASPTNLVSLLAPGSRCYLGSPWRLPASRWGNGCAGSRALNSGLYKHTCIPLARLMLLRVAPGSPPHPPIPSCLSPCPSEMVLDGEKRRPDSDQKRRENICLKSCLALPSVWSGPFPPSWWKSHDVVEWGAKV